MKDRPQGYTRAVRLAHRDSAVDPPVKSCRVNLLEVRAATREEHCEAKGGRIREYSDVTCI